MVGIDEFARKAVARFSKSKQGRPEISKLNLSPEAVEHFIKSSYYASLIPDENRGPCVSLRCYEKGNEKSFYICFDSPRDISAHEIAKMSHAVADDCHICCISDNGKLTIGGIGITRPYERRDLGYSSFRTANPLKLFIRGPGHIEMSTGGPAIVYKSGEILKESTLQYSRIMTELESAICQQMQPYTCGTVEALKDIFNDIAKAIVRLGHGGLLLVAPEPKECYFSSLIQVDSLLLQQLLIQYWNSIYDLLTDSGGKSNLLANTGGVGSRYSLIVAANTEMLEKCIRAVAQLEGIDGAIFLNYECKVIAFNAIIAKSEDDPNAYRFFNKDNANIDYKDVVGNRGSRHQSALSFVMRVPKSFAFVISQDGFVSAFHNWGKDLQNDNEIIMCAREMRVLE